MAENSGGQSGGNLLFAGESEANPWFFGAGAAATGNRPEIFLGIFATDMTLIMTLPRERFTDLRTPEFSNWARFWLQ